MMVPDKRDTLGNIPQRFDSMLAGALAKEEERPMKRKLSTTLLVAALLIILLAATALAVSLSRSAQGDAIHMARQALGAKYGLTTETLGLFRLDVTADEDGYTVTYTDENDEESRRGTYTVTISKNGKADAVWSHDDVDPALWQGKGLDAPVWGQEQLMEALAQNEARQQAYFATDWSEASFEMIAERGGYLSLPKPDDTFESFVYAVPGEEDIPADQARKTAMEAIAGAYGFEEADLAAYTEETVSFVQPEEGGQRQFVIELREPYPLSGWLSAQIASPSGEVIGCRWYIEDARRTLPEGPLDKYRHAVSEYMGSGALTSQPAAMKADIARRVKDAGLEALIEPALPYAAPGEQDIAESAAIAAAGQALMDGFSFTADTLSLFETGTTLLDEEDGRRWIIDFSPADFENWYLDGEWGKDKLGSYAVTLDAADGDVIEAAWSLADAWRDEGYTQANWAEAPAFHGKLLPWLLQLTRDLADVASRYPEDTTIYDYSDEDIAEYDGLFRDAGFSRQQFSHGLPGPGELSREEAQKIAREALLAEMPVPEEILDEAVVQGEFNLTDPDQHKWGFSFQFTYEDIFVDFGVLVDAGTGEVLLTNSVTGANG